jgi:hypothetical protein
MIGHIQRDLRAVSACQHDVIGVVLEVVLLVDDSPKPQRELAARRHAGRIIGRSGFISARSILATIQVVPL